MKTFAIAAIDAYQRFISPYKGFRCAHRVRTGGASCSQFAKRALDRLGMMAGILVTIRRFEACAASARILFSAEVRAAAAPSEAPAEACPLWSRWGARKLSACCSCWPS
ncbi:membrane protein insertion efficiency factor YidD [Variovorax paradoxus]|uniref:membrane protein insertion efficiency factor YidD n=1 Tax=Variovorax paradoxus TaxID=34073 RepID=UPI003522593D